MENKVLNIPFDEAVGSALAHDYSPSGLHADVVGGDFIVGREGNCLFFPGYGFAEIVSQPLDFSDDFTVMCWAKKTDEISAARILIVYSNEANNKEIPLNNTFGNWVHIAITRSGNIYTAYLDGIQQYGVNPVTASGIPVGLCVGVENGFNGPGYCYLDDFAVINGKAYTSAELDLVLKKATLPVRFYFNGIDLKSIGVIVSKPKGITTALAKKIISSHNWTDRHGEAIDVTRIKYESRQIELECWMTAPNRQEMMDAIFEVRALFEKDGLQRLMIEIGLKPLIYDVFVIDEVDFDDVEWKDRKAFCKFTIKMKEPQPVKRILSFIKNNSSGDPTITLTSKEAVNIYWGDGSFTPNVYGTNVVVSHPYAENGTYYINVAGNIENITSFSSNAVILWSKLQ